MLRRLFPSLAGAATAAPRALAHRPILKRDAERMRWAGDGGFVLPRDNPGVRVEAGFVSEAEGAELAAELGAAASEYGYPYEGNTAVHLLDSDSGAVEATLDGVVNNVRVTGRIERPDIDQKIPPWGYGDDFDASALPPAIGNLADKIANCGHFHVGPPRDVTINLRDQSFFQLDPHCDPPSDGPDVFILGLESSVVLTFTPPEGEAPRRREPREVGLRSWSDRDVDVLFEPRSLVHFSGAARHPWMHAIRSGVQVDGADGPITCDWWGQPDYLLRRGRRRLSVVLAFGAPS